LYGLRARHSFRARAQFVFVSEFVNWWIGDFTALVFAPRGKTLIWKAADTVGSKVEAAMSQKPRLPRASFGSSARSNVNNNIQATNAS
jgi:hypothetical protein